MSDATIPVKGVFFTNITGMVGQKLGQYRLLERLASGGMGTVYRAVDETLDRIVAIKLFDADIDDPERFRTEATTIARFNHPGIATVYELFQEEQWVMVMEFIDGETLEQLIARLGPLTPEHAADICMQALTALAYSHRMGIIHRDLKPSNLMITSSGAVKMMDFGVAKVLGSAHRTHTGFTMGTPAYMAPEQVKGEPLDARTDLYAMGVVLFRLLSGRLPFQGKTPFAVAQLHVSEAPQSVRALNPDLPEWTDAILARALAKPPDDRFQSADEFRHALKQSATHPASYGLDRVTSDVTEPLAIGSPSGAGAFAVWSSLAVAVLVASAIGTNLAWPTFVRHAEVPRPRQRWLPSRTLPVSPYGSLLPALAGPDFTDKAAAPLMDRETAAAVHTAAVAVPSAFAGVKLLTEDAGKTGSRDVILHLSTDRLILLPNDGAPPIAAFLYRDVQQATYVHARDPQWDPALSPSLKIGGSGVLPRARHWFVVQTKQAYAVLQLDGEQWAKIVRAFELRAGVKVMRPNDKKID